MLDGNPDERISVKKCIKSPIFDNIRIHKLELPASEDVVVQIDNFDLSDYETTSPLK